MLRNACLSGDNCMGGAIINFPDSILVAIRNSFEVKLFEKRVVAYPGHYLFL
jgi:hypothetical protein